MIPLRRATSLLAAALSLAAACGGTSVARRASDSLASGGSRTLAACYDSVEARALACSGGVARRVGDTLFVRLEDGHEKLFLNGEEGEAPGGYQYYGHLAHSPLHIIESNGHETYPEKLFLDTRSGESETLGEVLVISPDSSRVLASASDWGNCTEGGGGYLAVWRMTDSLPALEWHLQTFDCRTSGWGATNLRWHGRDTIAFEQSDAHTAATTSSASPTTQHSRPMLLVYGADGWRVTQPVEK